MLNCSCLEDLRVSRPQLQYLRKTYSKLRIAAGHEMIDPVVSILYIQHIQTLENLLFFFFFFIKLTGSTQLVGLSGSISGKRTVNLEYELVRGGGGVL